MTMVESPNTNKRGVFFDLLFGQEKGYLCIVRIAPGDKSVIQERYLEWPRFRAQVLEQIDTWGMSGDVYYCTSLLEKPHRKKEYCKPGQIIWADLDECKPEVLDVQPTITIQSSPGRYQAIWRLNEIISPLDAENASRRLAYNFYANGADRSGWDLTQLLRVPLTRNHKYGTIGNPGPEIYIVDIGPSEYKLEDFAHYPQVKGYEWNEIEFDPEQLPKATGHELMDNYKFSLAPRAIALFQDDPTEDWSQALYQLEVFLFEAGLDRYEVFTVCRDAACNKFKRDNLPESYLWKDICRVEAKRATELNTFGGDWALATGASTILSEEEMAIARGYRTIVEDYAEWGNEVSDAAPQYHIAGAFTVLSALLSGSIKIPTSFGTIKPNLWFMICADTTLTRKSTAMDMAMDLLGEIIPDALMATDGSLEGLMAAMSARPKKPSVFFRDEFSGLIDMMNKRDYYAGMMEAFTKLYDGRYQKRILRRETIELVEPILIILAGGIKDRILTLLNAEFISSGFIPRFIFTMAESDINRMRPLGPPTSKTLGQRNQIADRLNEVYQHYSTPQIVTIGGVALETPKEWEVTLTDGAWAFYARMESTLMQMALRTPQADLVTPMYARLCMSGLKCAALLAAFESLEEAIVVDEKHLIKAFSYIETWRLHADDVINNIGRSSSETLLDDVMKMIKVKPGISKSEIMNRKHLTSKEFGPMADTLRDRGLVQIRVEGKSLYFTSLLKDK